MSAEEFWDVIETYNTQIWPTQLVFYIIIIALVAWLFLKPGSLSNVLIKLYFFFSFGLSGTFFFFIFYSKSSGLADSYFLGSLFTIVALLFAVDIYKQKMVFCLPRISWQRWGTLILVLFVFCYPLFSIAIGRSFYSIIFPGTLTCPTTAIALILLTTALPRVDKIIYFILLFFSVTPTFSQLPKYGVYEDSIMLGIGIYSLIMLVTHWREKPVLSSCPIP